MAVFGVKMPNDWVGAITHELIKIFNTGKHFKGTDFDALDLSNLCVSISTLEIKKKNFVEFICKLTKDKLKWLSNTELINVVQASKFLWEFDQDFYLKTHSECV